MSGYTPGPWTRHPKFEEYVVPLSDAEKAIGASADPVEDKRQFAKVIMSYLRMGEERMFEPGERAANARLIAAAPDLLEAAKLAESVLSHMAKVLDYHPEGGTAVPKLQAAIAKAEGR